MIDIDNLGLILDSKNNVLCLAFVFNDPSMLFINLIFGSYGKERHAIYRIYKAPNTNLQLLDSKTLFYICFNF